jgi:uncharacterized protein
MPFDANPLPRVSLPEGAEEHMVPMRDGVHLGTDLYLPDQSTERPTVLIRTIYDRRDMLTYLPLIAEYLVERGFSVVTQDTRGAGNSEGELAQWNDIDDGYDTLEWIVQQPWSTGSVVGFGDSYYGWTQWSAAMSGHPALKAIVPRGIGVDIANCVVYPGGAFSLALMSFFAAFTMDRNVYDYEVPLDYSVRPLNKLIESWVPGAKAPHWDEYREAAPGDRYWKQPHFWNVRPELLNIPALHIGGWWDEFRRWQMSDWQVARGRSDAPQYLRMEIADHVGNQLTPDDQEYFEFRDSVEGIRSYLPRYLDPAISFWDREVLGIDDGSISPVYVEVVEAGVWRGETWPPPSARREFLYLTEAERAADGLEGGALSASPTPESQTAEWVHDPQNLVPFLQDDPISGLQGVPPDERQVEEREDVLTFTAEPVTEPIDMMGRVKATLQASGDAPVIQLVAKLVDVFPNGRARRFAEGILQLERPDPSQPVEIDLSDVAYRLLPGHRLRLELAASCFPRYMPVIDPDGDSWSAVSGPRVPYRLRTGGLAESYLSFMVADEQLEE